eukprot:4462607-Amphidinium_carterae.1
MKLGLDDGVQFDVLQLFRHALYRRACANMKLSNFELAIEDQPIVRRSGEMLSCRLATGAS